MDKTNNGKGNQEMTPGWGSFNNSGTGHTLQIGFKTKGVLIPDTIGVFSVKKILMWRKRGNKSSLSMVMGAMGINPFQHSETLRSLQSHLFWVLRQFHPSSLVALKVLRNFIFIERDGLFHPRNGYKLTDSELNHVCVQIEGLRYVNHSQTYHQVDQVLTLASYVKEPYISGNCQGAVPSFIGYYLPQFEAEAFSEWSRDYYVYSHKERVTRGVKHFLLFDKKYVDVLGTQYNPLLVEEAFMRARNVSILEKDTPKMSTTFGCSNVSLIWYQLNDLERITYVNLLLQQQNFILTDSERDILARFHRHDDFYLQLMRHALTTTLAGTERALRHIAHCICSGEFVVIDADFHVHVYVGPGESNREYLDNPKRLAPKLMVNLLMPWSEERVYINTQEFTESDGPCEEESLFDSDDEDEQFCDESEELLDGWDFSAKFGYCDDFLAAEPECDCAGVEHRIDVGYSWELSHMRYMECEHGRKIAFNLASNLVTFYTPPEPNDLVAVDTCCLGCGRRWRDFEYYKHCCGTCNIDESEFTMLREKEFIRYSARGPRRIPEPLHVAEPILDFAAEAKDVNEPWDEVVSPKKKEKSWEEMTVKEKMSEMARDIERKSKKKEVDEVDSDDDSDDDVEDKVVLCEDKN